MRALLLTAVSIATIAFGGAGNASAARTCNDSQYLFGLATALHTVHQANGSYTAELYLLTAQAYLLRGSQQLRATSLPCNVQLLENRTHGLVSLADQYRFAGALARGDTRSANYWTRLGTDASDLAGVAFARYRARLSSEGLGYF